MGINSESAPARPRSSPPRLVQVVRITEITPRMRRITLGGAEMTGFPADRQGSHVKVLIPRVGQVRPVLPVLGPSGPQWPPADVRPFARTYTVRAYDPAVDELDLDFVLHTHGGPATQWAGNAAVGAWVGIAGPGQRDPLPQQAEWYLFAGDESALPAIAAQVERLPRGARGCVLVEVADAADEQHLETPAGVRVQWVHRSAVAAGKRAPLVEEVQRLTWPDAGTIFGWVAGEEGAVKAIRSLLLTQRGLERSAVHAVPYWKAGMAEEAYHDERHRIMDGGE